MLMTEGFGEARPSISPDGRWLAYESNESGQLEVYVRPFPNLGDSRVSISTNGGLSARWSPDGRELYFQGQESIMAVRVETAPRFKVLGTPEVVFSLNDYISVGFGNNRYDVAPDGRFVITKRDPKQGTPQLVFVQNWFEELKRLVPKK
jgi:eukaryotic-like serine/threonine-protein kinase